MYYTPFFPFFFAIFIYAMIRPANWAIATGAMVFFQAASPIALVAGGKVSGLAPAYGLIPIGVFYVVKQWIRNRNRKTEAVGQKIALPTWLIGYFTFISVGGAILLPRLFEKSVNVLASGYGLDSGFTVPLKPSGSNYIQSLYLVLNLCLVAIPAILAREKLLTRSNIITGITIGAMLSALLGYYQIIAYYAHLPWPDVILNSNFGAKQLQDQTMMGFKRMSATFLEPTLLAQHFLSAVGLLLLGLGKKRYGLFILFALLISTSSSAYFGLIILIMFWSLFDIKSRLPQTIKLLAVLLVVILVAYGADYYATGGLYTKYLIFGKFSSQSGESRLYADSLAIQTLIQTYGLGAGVGSLRSSSFLVGLLATAGIHGFVLFIAFMAALFVHLKNDASPEARCILFGLIGCVIGWALSVPDSAIPLFWLLAGAALIGYGQPITNVNTGKATQ